MMCVIAVFSFLWGIALGIFWERITLKRPAIWIIQGEIEFAAVVLAGGLVETLLILGAVFL
jgi:hypothetical protein